jgi:predicted RNA binding protein YcfA (HicA-like mRNA interferase family)
MDDLKSLRKLAIKQGWRVETTRGGHIKWYPVHGTEFVVTSSTPSDYRAIRNIRSMLKRYGLVLDK